MNFDLNEDQAMLRAMVQRFVADRCGADHRRCARRTAAGFSQDNWSALADAGLLAAPLPIFAGGMALGPVDLLVIFQELGRGLALEPLAESVIAAGAILAESADGAVQTEWIEAIAKGARRVAVAHRERNARYNTARVETSAKLNGRGVLLTGEKVAVDHAIGADGYIVSALGREGKVELYLVSADAAGLEIVPYRQIDGSVTALMHLREVAPIAALSGGIGAIRAAEARLSFVRSAEAIGIMDLLIDSTLDYIRQRRQFGHPIGSFQAIQHRMAAQYVALEQARSLLYWSAMQNPEGGEEWARQLAGARSFIVDAAIKLGHEAIQLHGGMGVSDELDIGHALKRLVQIARGSEPAKESLDRFAGLC